MVNGEAVPDALRLRPGDDVARGIYTMTGSQVVICFGTLCNELTLDGDCLVDDNEYHSRYCKE